MANYPYMNYQQPVYGYPYGQPGMSMPAVQPMQNYQPVQNAQPVQPVQPAQNVQPAQTGFNGRFVTSREEAVASQIPFDGTTTYFVNTANGEIYSKAYNFANGSAPIETYVKQATQAIQSAQVAPAPDYAPFFNAIGERISSIDGRLNELVERLNGTSTAKAPAKNTAKGNE